MQTKELSRFDRIISLEDVIELSSDKHATDAFAEKIRVKVEDYQPEFSLSENEKLWALDNLPQRKGDGPLLGVQLTPGARNRAYPMEFWTAILGELERRGWEILLFGKEGQVPPVEKWLGGGRKIYDLSIKGYTFRQSAALFKACDAYLGIDSSFLQLARAFKIPGVALFGPVDWKLRVREGENITCLTGTSECKGCYWHHHRGQSFPDQLCRKRNFCHVLAEIKPERVVAKVDALRS